GVGWRRLLLGELVGRSPAGGIREGQWCRGPSRVHGEPWSLPFAGAFGRSTERRLSRGKLLQASPMGLRCRSRESRIPG
ncbi:hypothetical protein K3X02_15040, partial [Listeria monocytogenes]|nr:hypothetical protein [Listeria monocytogenes]